MAAPYPQQGGYQQVGVQPGTQPVVLQVIQERKSSSDSFLKVCGCLAGTGLAICVGAVAGCLILVGTVFLAVGVDDMMTTGIVLVAIGGFLLIGSCFACSHFRKEMNNKGQVYNQPTLITGQPQQAGQIYNQPQVAAPGQALISPVAPQPLPGGAGYSGPHQQPPPGSVYPGPHQQPSGIAYPGAHQHQQYPAPPPGYSAAAVGPMQQQQQSYGPGYIPGQIGGTIPEQPAPPYSSKAGEAAAATAPMAPTDHTSEYDRPPAYAP